MTMVGFIYRYAALNEIKNFLLKYVGMGRIKYQIQKVFYLIFILRPGHVIPGAKY